LGVAIDMHVEDGAYILGDSPGLGIRLDENAIAASSNRLPDPRSDGGPNIRPEHAGHRLLAIDTGRESKTAALNA
jgi:hypothetical protein